MTEGKKGWNLFQAFRDFCPTLRSLRHSGLVVNHFVFDRTICSIMGRRINQHHCLYYQLKHEGHEPGNLADSLEVDLDWFVVQGCACHDIHNSLKWAMTEVEQPLMSTTTALRSSAR